MIPQLPTQENLIFDKVNSDYHIISVSLPGFEYYIDTVSVQSDTVIDIHISCTKEDYFPIQVNTQKRFEYHYGSGGGFFWIPDLVKQHGTSIR